MGVLSRAFLGLGIALGVTSASFAASEAADLSDSDIERVLSKGKITKKEDIGTGVTNPLRFWIELEGVTVSASFKDVDYESARVTRSASRQRRAQSCRLLGPKRNRSPEPSGWAGI